MVRIALLVVLLGCSASIAFALPPELSSTRVIQAKGSGDVPHAGILGGGDTFATATVIAGLPYNDTGNTCPFVNDYAPPCMITNAPDVVYRYTPATNQCVNISLCGSAFDTGLWIYDQTTNTSAACQDDSPECYLQSNITGLALTAGHVYDIIVDGYYTACGDYQLAVSECPQQPVCDPCPPNAVVEGEPVCGDGYQDVFNSGCNSSPPVFLTLPCDPDLTISA